MAADRSDGTPGPATPGAAPRPEPDAAARPRPVPGVLQRDLGTEYVFYDTRGERFHVLNETAREIFLLCDGSRSRDDIARALTGTRDVDPVTADKDVGETIDRMVRLGLLLLS